MFAIAFDLTVADAEAVHPSGRASAAYADICKVLEHHGFHRIQGSVYVTEVENLERLTTAMVALKALSWFPGSVRDIRGFRVEQWSDFTPFFKGRPSPP